MTYLILMGPSARGFARRAAATALATLLFALAPAVSLAAMQERPDSAAIEALKLDFDAIEKQTLDDPAARIDTFDVGPPAADEAGRMHQVVRRFMNSILRVRNAYLAELDTMGWVGILDADRLKADTDLADSRRLVEMARAAGVRAERDALAAFNGFAALVEAADLRPRTKREIIAGFERSRPGALAEMRASYALEAQTVDEFDAMVELLARTDWDVEDSQILFNADADVEAYNAHFTRIDELTKQLEARQKANVDRARDRLSSPGP